MKKIAVVIGIGVVLMFLWYRVSLRAVDVSDETRRPVTIEKGTSVDGISRLLEEKDVIRSARAFRLYTRLHGIQASLQAGDFFLRKNMDVLEVIEVLQKGFSEEIVLTIPEGFTVKDIDALLTEKGLITAGDFVACASNCDLTGYSFLPTGGALAKRGGKVEGFLYPDTYFVLRDGFTSEAFMKRLIDTFRKRVIDSLGAEIAASKKSLQQIVTMASLVEEETRTDEERPVVAGILWKRFDANQGLGVDATVRYILEKPSASITAADLEVDSPYNLRKYRGLPPGPIASPGLASIKATLQPQASEYWYYLHGKDGQIRYAQTNDEHNRNKQAYLR